MRPTKPQYMGHGVNHGKVAVKLDMAAVAATYNVTDSVGIYLTRPSSALDGGVFWIGLAAASGFRSVRKSATLVAEFNLAMTGLT